MKQTYRDVAQFGSAFASGVKGRRFKSCHPDQSDPREDGGVFYLPIAFFADPKS